MSKQGKRGMTTIKVEKQVGAMVSIAVKKRRAQGDTDMTANRLLRELLEMHFPDVVELIDPEGEEPEAEA